MESVKTNNGLVAHLRLAEHRLLHAVLDHKLVAVREAGLGGDIDRQLEHALVVAHVVVGVQVHALVLARAPVLRLHELLAFLFLLILLLLLRPPLKMSTTTTSAASILCSYYDN